VDPGEIGAALQAGGVWGPACQKGKRAGSWHQTVEGDRRERDAAERRGRARHNIKSRLCTEYVSLCIVY
jgi:hypothetical protein